MADLATTGEDPSERDRRERLVAAKLRALVRSVDPSATFGDDPAYPPGAAAMVGDTAWVLVDDRPGQAPGRRLGSALAWAHRRAAATVHVVAATDTGTLARRAAAFALPVRVWTVVGDHLEEASPAPLPVPSPPPAAHLDLIDVIRAGGATPVVEHGVVTGEVRGLEVCRVVDEPDDGDSGVRARLDVGVGVNDREAFRMLHGDAPTTESLARVVAAVAEHRRPGAARHPFNRMAAERFLRWRLEQEPARHGLRELVAAEPPEPRRSAVEPVPCVAHGTDGDGRRVVVVCSSGVDLDVVAYAADARAAARAAADVDRTWVVTPARDQLPITAELAARLREPVELIALDPV